jgi:phosphotransferase system enzyme I (PtsI)
VIELKGIPVSPGIAIRKAFILGADEERSPQRYIRIDEVERETGRFEAAHAKARAELEEAQRRYAGTFGADIAQIFKFHQLMLEDKALVAEIRKRISANKFTAEFAVQKAFESRVKMFQSSKDEVIRERDKDVRDVERRIKRALSGQRIEEMKGVAEEVILIATDLTPSQTAELDPTRIAGFATAAGGRTSHTAIVARSHKIPAIVGLGDELSQVLSQAPSDAVVILDGTKGKLIVQPDEETLKDYLAREKAFIEFERDLGELLGLPAETLDGHKVTLLANIEFPDEIEDAIAKGAEGIGLYRTEFLYTRNPEPDEETHFKAYKQAVELCGGRPLVIRTLDLGADKFSEGAVRMEPNPFLGCRSIRLCFQRIDLFKTQLRAIFRASAYGPLKLMLPMISSLSEVRRAKLVINDVMDDLERERIVFDPKVPIGIMVEVPSAALLADFLAEEVSFFSIGTNDLVQYTLAVDRVNERVADLYQPAHPAILRLLHQVIEAGARQGVEVSMCGEMSGEVVYTIPLIGLGLRNFSISPGSIPEVKKVVRSTTLRESVEEAEKIFTFRDAKQTDNYLREKARRIIPQLF